MHDGRAVHRTIVVFDVERFGDHRRTNRHRAAVREGLYRSVSEAFGRAGISWTRVDLEDRGDGNFVRLPPEVLKHPAYIAKYIQRMGPMFGTPEQFARFFSVALIIEPARLHT